MRILLLCLFLVASSARRGLDRPQSDFDPSCKPTCDEIEATELKPMAVCAKYRLYQPQPLIGDVCTDAFMKGFKKVCRDACNSKAKSSDSVAKGGDKIEYRRPKVAKCTGMGSPLKMESCQAGYFDAVDQTLVALGLMHKKEKKRMYVGLKEGKVHVKELVKVEAETEAEEGKAEEDKVKAEDMKEDIVDMKTEEEIRAKEAKVELMRIADKQVRQNQDIDTYLEFPHSDGQTYTIELHRREPISDAVTHFCRDILKTGDVSTCSREVMVYFRINFPEKLRNHEQ